MATASFMVADGSRRLDNTKGVISPPHRAVPNLVLGRRHSTQRPTPEFAEAWWDGSRPRRSRARERPAESAGDPVSRGPSRDGCCKSRISRSSVCPLRLSEKRRREPIQDGRDRLPFSPFPKNGRKFRRWIFSSLRGADLSRFLLGKARERPRVETGPEGGGRLTVVNQDLHVLVIPEVDPGVNHE